MASGQATRQARRRASLVAITSTTLGQLTKTTNKSSKSKTSLKLLGKITGSSQYSKPTASTKTVGSNKSTKSITSTTSTISTTSNPNPTFTISEFDEDDPLFLGPKQRKLSGRDSIPSFDGSSNENKSNKSGIFPMDRRSMMSDNPSPQMTSVNSHNSLHFFNSPACTPNLDAFEIEIISPSTPTKNPPSFLIEDTNEDATVSEKNKLLNVVSENNNALNESIDSCEYSQSEFHAVKRTCSSGSVIEHVFNRYKSSSFKRVLPKGKSLSRYHRYASLDDSSLNNECMDDDEDDVKAVTYVFKDSDDKSDSVSKRMKMFKQRAVDEIEDEDSNLRQTNSRPPKISYEKAGMSYDAFQSPIDGSESDLELFSSGDNGDFLDVPFIQPYSTTKKYILNKNGSYEIMRNSTSMPLSPVVSASSGMFARSMPGLPSSERVPCSIKRRMSMCQRSADVR